MHRQLAIGVVRSDDDGAPAATSSPPLDDEPSLFLTRLFSSETQYMTDPDYGTRCQTRPVYRQDAINSILKVHDHFQFRPETAFLSINYLDRFLFSHTIPEIGWAFQLVSVACLSLAAKMVEVNVPLLLDLQQTVDQSYVFEPKTVQRMELLVTTSLQWRLHSVTPFGYLKHFVSNISDCEIGDDELQSLSSSIILNTTRVIDFLKFPPSVIAAAAVISAAGVEVAVSDAFDERLDKSMVRSCHQLMEEYLVDTCPFVKAEPAMQVDGGVTPASPVGVLDTAACVSCDTHSENHVSGTGNKRLRLSETTSVQEP